MSSQTCVGEISLEELEVIELITRRVSTLLDIKASLEDTSLEYDKALVNKMEDDLAAAKKENNEWWESFNREKGWNADYIDFDTRKVYKDWKK